MIIAINYADKTYKRAQRLNTKSAYKMGADIVIEYSEESISDEFKRANSKIWNSSRGGGYWIWKPYVILKTLEEIASEGDYVVYTDSGSAFVNNISNLIDCMNADGTDIMAFAIDQIERSWDKRDAIILMDCDCDEYLNSAQICGGYSVIRKNSNSVDFVKKWLEYCTDERIITDAPNVMGLDNYPDFIDNRHDQTIWSLLCKKNGIRPFRDPSQWGNDYAKFADEVIERSNYPQVIESHRRGWIQYRFQLEYEARWWYCIPRKAIKGYFKILRILGNEKGNI